LSIRHAQREHQPELRTHVKTSRITPADLRRSVIAVPPMPRMPNGSVNSEANGLLLNHLRAGCVTTFMYGSNANFDNLGIAELGRVLDALVPLLGADDWLIPSVGAGFGKAAEQIVMLRERAFPTAMVLPRCAFLRIRKAWLGAWGSWRRFTASRCSPASRTRAT
jgi:hypothetical protein